MTEAQYAAVAARNPISKEQAKAWLADYQIGDVVVANCDWNVADREQQVNGRDATDYQCYRAGQLHRGYGWAKHPSADWNSAQLALYDRGYDGKPIR